MLYVESIVIKVILFHLKQMDVIVTLHTLTRCEH